MSSFISGDGMSETQVRVAPPIIAVEFSSRERCITAAKFTKTQPKIYNAFCVQK